MPETTRIPTRIGPEKLQALTAEVAAHGTVDAAAFARIFSDGAPADVDPDDDESYRAYMLSQGYSDDELPTLDEHAEPDDDPLMRSALAEQEADGRAFAEAEEEAEREAEELWPAAVAAAAPVKLLERLIDGPNVVLADVGDDQLVADPHHDTVALTDVNEPDLDLRPGGCRRGGRRAQLHRQGRGRGQHSDSDNDEQTTRRHDEA